MKKLFTLIVLGFAIASLQAQISESGTPFSFDKRISDDDLQQTSTPGFDVNALVAEDLITDQIKDIPWRFGQNFYQTLNCQSDGEWTLLPDGSKIWRLKIFSKGAYHINLAFDDFYLPEGSKLYVYNTDHSHVIGAFTSTQNNIERKFATTLVKGETIIVEYNAPAEVDEAPALQISRITHGYRDAYAYADKGLGSSGSCNNNVVCPEAAGWENQIRAACMLVTGGSGFCSASLVNNTAENGTPYVLTAHHCATSNDFAQWIFWFNWQSATCTNPTSSPAYNSISGSVLKARNDVSDFCLVQMNQTPPTNYNVYYAGWSKVDTASTSSVCIHHPSGDIKKISFDDDPSISDKYLGSQGIAGSHWKIAAWNDGTTEGGSSGSPLYDQNHRIIGQLHGGYASCSAMSEADYYGKFAMSWEYGTSSATRLRDWLDPSNLGVSVLDGHDFNTPTAQLDAAMNSISSPSGISCGATASLNPSITIRNGGATTLTSLDIKYGIQGQSMNTYNWTGSLAYSTSAVVNLPSINVTSAGNYTFLAYVENPNAGADEDGANDSLTSQFELRNGVGITMTLLTDNYSDETSWILRDSLGNIVYQSAVLSDETTYIETWCLNPNQCYLFTIYDDYGDGLSGGYGVPPGTFSIDYNQTNYGSGGDDFGDSAQISFCAPDAAGINQISNASTIKIFPVPAKDVVFVTGFTSDISFTLFDIAGKSILSESVSSQKMIEIRTSNLEDGVYILKTMGEKAHSVHRILIAR
ncbi:MAG: trypsin-like peptidase domain-containing protein [Bacteroidetes bacterium]|nr:trypsin-like peptidase domain-containing protein [Bacteroidota bacterium]MBU1719642.1 trypsin-like peptidase domain-containing protein [Bacteroidota bacterium]